MATDFAEKASQRQWNEFCVRLFILNSSTTDTTNSNFQTVMGLAADDSQLKVDALKVLNQYLADRTTLGGTKLTENDKAMFKILYQQYASMTYAEKEQFINVSRWIAFLQNEPEILDGRSKIPFSRIQLYK